MSGNICFVLSYPLASFEQVQNFEPTRPDKDVWWMNVLLRKYAVHLNTNVISHYKKIGYNINVLQQTACLVVKPIAVGNFTFLFNCRLVGRTSDSMTVPT